MTVVHPTLSVVTKHLTSSDNNMSAGHRHALSDLLVRKTINSYNKQLVSEL